MAKNLKEKVKAGIEEYYVPTSSLSSPEKKQETTKEKELKKDKLVVTSLKLPASHHKTIKVYATRTNQNIQDILKDALDLYFETNGIKLEQ